MAKWRGGWAGVHTESPLGYSMHHAPEDGITAAKALSRLCGQLLQNLCLPT